MRRCHGIYLEDLEGRRYMDVHGNSVHQVGVANPSVIAAIKAQLDDLACCTWRDTNAPAVELARTLARITPGDLGTSLERLHRRNRALTSASSGGRTS